MSRKNGAGEHAAAETKHARAGLPGRVSAVLHALHDQGVPWGKILTLTALIVADLEAGKSVMDVVKDVLATLQAGGG